jgi:hypothetical protein
MAAPRSSLSTSTANRIGGLRSGVLTVALSNRLRTSVYPSRWNFNCPPALRT